VEVDKKLEGTQKEAITMTKTKPKSREEKRDEREFRDSVRFLKKNGFDRLAKALIRSRENATKPKKRTWNGWAVVTWGGKMQSDYLKEHAFELEKHAPRPFSPQRCFVVCPTQGAAEQWLRKWRTIERSRVIPVTITERKKK